MIAMAFMPSAIEILILFMASLSFLAAFFWAVPTLRGSGDMAQASRWPMVQSGIAVGVLLTVALLVFRSRNEEASALPLYNYLDLFLILTLLLAGLLVYFRWTHYLKGFSLFLLPMMAALLLLGELLDALNHGEFHDATPWTRVHVVAIVLGSACFAAGCVCGAVYLLVDRQLRRKGMDPSQRWSGLPPLASMERFMQRTIFLGFPLLTIAIIAGILSALQQPAHLSNQWTSPKLILSAAAWLIYGLLLHVKWTPSFRGARAAWLSIIGFVLLMAVYFIVNLMAKGG